MSKEKPIIRIIRSGLVNREESGLGSFWPSVCRLHDGRLAAAYSGGRRNHICPFGRVDISYSSDEGKTWSTGTTVLDTPLDDRDAGILVWKDKIVLTTFNNTIAFQRECLANYKRTDDERATFGAYLDTLTPEIEQQHLGSLLAYSQDGEHFSDYIKLPISSPHGPIPLADGRLLYIGKAFAPAQIWQGTPHGDGIFAMTTTDGENWSQPLPLPRTDEAELYEPHAIECKDGKILVAARAHIEGGRLSIMLCESFDGGKSYTPFRRTGIIGTPPHFLALSDGAIVMTYGRREKPFGIRAMISRDCGESWSGEVILRDDITDWDLGYPCSVLLKNGNILTVYYMQENGQAVINYTEWQI